jgi:hypothetical protein
MRVLSRSLPLYLVTGLVVCLVACAGRLSGRVNELTDGTVRSMDAVTGGGNRSISEIPARRSAVMAIVRLQ